MSKRKLIEVALPLEAINRASAKEKSIRHGHPSTLHPWWARRPLAAARAVLFAQLVDDPSSHPNEFPTEEAQQAERARLHSIIERLVLWENTRDRALLSEANAEIVRSSQGNVPPLIDPFAGGGTIPLEAQRLGLVAHGSDLNPVAVLINKALTEVPPRFAGVAPVASGVAASKLEWPDALGLAADVRAYGDLVRASAAESLNEFYPAARLPDGSDATVIAWIWARTVTCPNPACGIELPLVRSWWLSKKKGREAWIKPLISAGNSGSRRVEFEISSSPDGPSKDGTVSRRGGICIACGSSVPLTHIREQGREVGLGRRLMAIVADGGRQRKFLPPTAEQLRAAEAPVATDRPEGDLPKNPRDFKTPNYGLTKWCDLFTERQLVTLATFGNLVTGIRSKVLADALTAGMDPGEPLERGGAGAEAYADAVTLYLGLCASKMAMFHCSLARWRPDASKTAPAFGRQAIPIVWDYAEVMPFAGAGGDWSGVVDGAARTLENLLPNHEAKVTQEPAQSVALGPGKLISTDPPYYDNIGYSDLSDFFYVWLRRSLRDVFPDLLSTMLVPKAEELVANQYRHNGPDGAQHFFEEGFREVFTRARATAILDFPITVYYAVKQSDEGDDGASSTGWETLLDGMISAGWEITSTWPLRTEGGTRLIARDSNVLASSIVLSLRPRAEDAPSTDRRGLIQALRDELPDALRTLEQGNVAPVDLPQAVIGPGMAVFSRYSRVFENDGSPMTVRSALARINEILAQVLNEQEGDYDPATRFAIAWYRQHGYESGDFGAADAVARALNTSVGAVAREGIAHSAAGKVKLLGPAEMPGAFDVHAADQLGVWTLLHHLVLQSESRGIVGAGELIAQIDARQHGSVDLDLVKELAFLLFHVAEANSWTRDALAFNSVATAWPDIIGASRSAPAEQQLGMDLEG